MCRRRQGSAGDVISVGAAAEMAAAAGADAPSGSEFVVGGVDLSGVFGNASTVTATEEVK